jgi:hypothetical protein
MIVVTVLFESSAGSSIRKGLLRLAGTLAGAAVGLAILYFVVLANGLSHANHPQVRSSLLSPLFPLSPGACVYSCTTLHRGEQEHLRGVSCPAALSRSLC